MTQVSINAFMLEDASVLEDRKEVSFPQFAAPVILRSLTADQFNAIKKRATRPVKQNGMTVAKLNEELFSDLMAVESIVQPDLNNAGLQEHYGTVGKPADTIRMMLKAGQWGELLNEINKLSGFEEESMDDLVEDVKN